MADASTLNFRRQSPLQSFRTFPPQATSRIHPRYSVLLAGYFRLMVAWPRRRPPRNLSCPHAVLPAFCALRHSKPSVNPSPHASLSSLRRIRASVTQGILLSTFSYNLTLIIPTSYIALYIITRTNVCVDALIPLCTSISKIII